MGGEIRYNGVGTILGRRPKNKYCVELSAQDFLFFLVFLTDAAAGLSLSVAPRVDESADDEIDVFFASAIDSCGDKGRNRSPWQSSYTPCNRAISAQNFFPPPG